MTETRFACCPICDATCGLVVELDGGRVVRIRGDADDPLSRGHLCPKGRALQDLHEDPDRLRRPLRRRGDRWEELGWDEALDEVAERLAAVRRAHGADAVGLYLGTMAFHSFGGMLFEQPFRAALGTHSVYTAQSIDSLPRTLASSWLYGSMALVPVPDLDRTDFLLMVGANPVVSGGSAMTAPGMARRLEALRARGARVVVVDPVRTKTAALADEHLAIRPGTDALLLLALLHTLFEEGRVDRARIPAYVDGLDELSTLVEPWSPERVAAPTGLTAETIRALARQLAAAPSAACYGRMGTCCQAFGTLSTTLLDVLTLVTGNLDRPGGAMFATPAVDLAGLAKRVGQTGAFDRRRTRVSGLPDFNGELPVATLAEEMETPGPGQLRALVLLAGNPVLSLPEGRRVEKALPGLDFVVAIDPYLNETTCQADVILPPTVGLQRDNYALVFHAVAVRNTARFSPAVLPRGDAERHDWEILRELTVRLHRRRGVLGRAMGGAFRLAERFLTPRSLLRVLLRVGPYRRRLRMASLLAAPHGVDLGPLEPRLPRLLSTPGRRIRLLAGPVRADLDRLAAAFPAGAARDAGLTLLSRRDLRSQNSWAHNLPRLMGGKPRCTLWIHPDDARRCGVTDGGDARVRSAVGELVAPVEVTDAVRPGVVCLPHGWGHDRTGARLRVAAANPGVNVNDLIDVRRVDALSGCSDLYGMRVEVGPVIT